MDRKTDENSSLFAAVLRTAIDAIVTIDERGIIQHANVAVEKLFGYRIDEVIGQNVSILMPEPDRSHHDQYLSRYKETKKPAIIGVGRKVLGQRKDGSLIPLDLAISEIEVGGRVLFTGIMRDMTERNRDQANLRQAEERIIQAERLAAIGQMVTGLAHESRNALQRSRACLDMLALDLEGQSEQLDLVHRTLAALQEIQTLYEEVRSYASPIVLERSLQDIGKLCLEAWKNLCDEHGPKALELEIQNNNCPTCRVDVYRFSQVIRNIFENAIAASPSSGKIQVILDVPMSAKPREIRVRFLDQGPGLDTTQRERIFEPFYTTKTKGTGLGMAICKRIVEAHCGSIAVGNASTGAEIVIQLPIESS